MARLTAARRNALPDSAFADPKNRKYPMQDAGHARAALSRGAHNAGPKLNAKIKKKAKREYPSMKVKDAPRYPKEANDYV